ncbi:STAS domain-containing protein [Sporosarcina sp. JAI121]|uniref:STAS domain-containing protein n=1 Tax=Sporosarcina sp. JAI121 TaxID=2723064 RepID=UPI0015C7949B|nr:STAS domain-containing protein [Sporosarcina sp. JAI121]NYF26063.1 anti-anti-sigma regulatory factor/Holliday junction resolvase-like predicted endonuclease [Sporosarcina sp. JAI121]
MEKVWIDEDIKQYIKDHKQDFENQLLGQAVNVRDKIDDILRFGEIDLINNAHKLVNYVIDGDMLTELQLFAKQEGIAWATHSIPLSFKLEWVQAIRRTLWNFIQEYNKVEQKFTIDMVFILEKQFNNQIDDFLNSFFINYSTFKDSLILAQREIVETLSVPIIPITPSVCILPLIGAMDSFRTTILEEKVLEEINRLHFQTLIIDLSGIATMESNVIEHLMKTIYGTSMMGCRTIITGLRPDVVRQLISLGINFDKETKTFGTLQQALNEFLLK